MHTCHSTSELLEAQLSRLQLISQMPLPDPVITCGQPFDVGLGSDVCLDC
jgi:hypothetical protein